MTYSYNLNASQLIDMTLNMMTVKNFPDPSLSGDYKFALSVLNMMLKAWVTDGIRLAKRKQGALFVSYNQPSYELGSVSGSDNCSLVKGYVNTTTTVAIASGATTVTLTSTIGMSVNDNIGIELDNLSRQWTTITAINSTTNVVTIHTATTSTSAVGNTIITYTTKLNRPLEVLRATLLDLSTNTETPLEKLTYDEYFDTPIKTVNGRPVNFYYDRLLNNSIPYTGTMYLYLNPDSSKYIIRFSYFDATVDVVNPTDVLDFPQESLLAITTNLAVMLENFGYGKLTESQATQQVAMMEKDKLRSFDSDDEYMSISIIPRQQD